MAIMLESKNRRGFFIRHQNFEGELNEFEQAHGQDFHFEIVHRGSFQGAELVALKSVNFPKRFLRHKNFRLLLEEPPADGPGLETFKRDSQFFKEEGLGDTEGFSFRSENFPDHYIRHLDFHMFIGKKDTPNIKGDATFLSVPPR